MRTPKIRGAKRRTRRILREIAALTAAFPQDFENGYWHLHLPADYKFMTSSRTPRRAKRLCLQALLDGAARLAHLKPDNGRTYRAVVAVDLPQLWSSQIILFEGDDYFRSFFERNGEPERWTPLPASRSLQAEWRLSSPADWRQNGFLEVIEGEDGYRYEGEIWFIGELTTQNE